MTALKISRQTASRRYGKVFSHAESDQHEAKPHRPERSGNTRRAVLPPRQQDRWGFALSWEVALMGASKIHVHVVRYADCKNLVLRYRDPTTGRQVRKSAGTASKSEARRAAHAWEAALNDGRDQGPHAITWEAFRQRYEDEVVPSLAERTSDKITTAFNAVERLLPKVAAGRLQDLDAEAISRLQAGLRDGKRSENTIAAYLGHLRAALQWAADMGLIPAVPKIKKPQRASKRGRASKGKGRPLTGEEFERMLNKVPAALLALKQRKKAARKVPEGGWKRGPYQTAPVELDPQAVASWRHFLTGLWLSGLRLGEALDLYWDQPNKLCIDLTGKHPRLVIPEDCEKGHRNRLLPLTPDFAGFILATPPADRHGPVFNPQAVQGRASYDVAGRVIGLIGELAGVKVHTHPRTGKVKYASAHDLRRSFGDRWARKVMPAVLQRLMRHECIETTLRYYVGLDADSLAEELYRSCPSGQERPLGTVLGTVAQDDPRNGVSEGKEGIAVSDGNTSEFGER